MTTEELALRYSYGIIEDWSELVERITENNLIIKMLLFTMNGSIKKVQALPEEMFFRETT